MLQVILQILYILLIIIICILGLLIVSILVLLFSPIRYRLRGEKDTETTQLSVKITYLFRIVTVLFEYPSDEPLQIRIFGRLRKKKVDRKRKPVLNDEKSNQGKSNKDNKDNISTSNIEETTKKDISINADQNTSNNTDESKKQSIKGFHPIVFLKKIINKFLYTIRSIYDKIKHIKDDIAYYKNILTDPLNKSMYIRLINIMKRVLKKLLPHRMIAEITFGTGSPDTTGYIYGLYGMLLPYLGKRFIVKADFENTILQGFIFAKGSITPWTIIIQAGKIYFDKQLRIFLNQLKREDK